MELIVDSRSGPASRYSDAYLFMVLDSLHRNGCMSRKALVDDIGLGEGSVRSMLNVLKSWRWIEVNRAGSTLTEFGKASFEGFGIRYVDFCDRKYVLGGCQQAVIVAGAASKVTNGMAQRDLAVMNGAIGASVFVMRDGKILFPTIWDMDEGDPEAAGRIRATGLKEGDALVVVGSDDPLRSKAAAAAVGLAMR